MNLEIPGFGKLYGNTYNNEDDPNTTVVLGSIATVDKHFEYAHAIIRNPTDAGTP